LTWSRYFKFRAEHPGDCELLTADDLDYAAQWTEEAATLQLGNNAPLLDAA
jgi:hypothetical protein